MTEELNNNSEKTPANEQTGTSNVMTSPENDLPAKNKINPILLALNLVALAGVIILFILHFTGTGSNSSSISGAIGKANKGAI